ncbi:MAG TPA: enoyl-CoA hydratase/isomerase family protein [Vicinamibacteria bacterium]|nr:enoyl-CoA hydratase/isomerase family protein [Vicinamibacteria bacterium]
MSTLRFDRQGALGIVRLDKGRGNAIDDALLEDLAKWAVEAARDDQLRGVLFTSAHPKLFCPGLDLVSLIERDREEMRDFMNRFATVLWGLFGLLKPVVAAINGPAVAGGCILALTADSRVAARGATIGLNEVKIGVPLPWSVVMLLKSTVPAGALSEVALLGRNFADEEARRVGLVDALAERDQLEQSALARLQEFAEKDALAFGATKGWMRSQAVATMKAHEAETADVWLDAWFSTATRERLRQTVDSLKKN